MVLCDNQVDRDFECFTKEALEKLKELFLGKTGILTTAFGPAAKRHGFTTARWRPCRTGNSAGRALQPAGGQGLSSQNRQKSGFYYRLDSGIKKEVSVGCAVNRLRCSVCGEDLKNGNCRHQKGKTYDGRLCWYRSGRPL